MRRPLCFDLFCGLGGFTEGFLAEGFDVIGFDVERHDYGTGGYPGQLVLQDVLTLDGAQFRDAACIVASPPCQEYSYMGMPWSRAKAIARALEGQGEFPEGYTGSRTIADLNALFNACFRLQREACEAAGRHIPMVVENVNKAQKWVGRAQARYGSYYLWGNVANVGGRIVATAAPVKFGEYVQAKRSQKFNPDGTAHGQGSWFAVADSKNRGALKVPGMNFHDHAKTGQPGRSFQSAAVLQNKQPVWLNDDKRRAEKCGGDWFGSGKDCSLMRRMSSKSASRKAASAQIAKIPFALSSWLARCFRPAEVAA